MRIDIDREHAIAARLRRLAQATADPRPNAETEAAILAAFDAAWSRGGSVRVRRRQEIMRIAAWAAIAAAAIVAVTVTATVVRLKPASTASDVRLKPDTTDEHVRLKPDTSDEHVRLKPDTTDNAVSHRRAFARKQPPTARTDFTEFVPWPGSSALPPLESGALVRVDLPPSVLPSLGVVPPSYAGLVEADLLIDQDGFARAIRFVPADRRRE
jgi:hypothetical protein